MNELRTQNLSKEQIDLIKNTIAKGATNEELALFIQVCNRTGLDPFARQVFAVKRWDRKENRETMMIQVSVDGFRLISERSGKYAGQLGPFWSEDGKEWLEVWLEHTPPKAAKVGILRHDFKEPLWAVATWDQYVQTTKDGKANVMWSKMGPLMLGKCAECLARRSAFPQELSGLYTPEEMGQADNELIVEPQQALPPYQEWTKEERNEALASMDDFCRILECAGYTPEEVDPIAARAMAKIGDPESTLEQWLNRLSTTSMNWVNKKKIA